MLRRLLLAALLCLSAASAAETDPVIRSVVTADADALGARYRVYCDSWRLSVETSNAGPWKTVPERCVGYVREYFQMHMYQSDCEVAATYALDFAMANPVAADGKDAWVFDVDETLLSNVPYYSQHGWGSIPFDEPTFDAWVLSGKAPAVQANLWLYNHLLRLGFKLFLLTGRGEDQRNVTEANLLSAGYRSWEKLILRGNADNGKAALQYKSEQRQILVAAGYRIQGSSGDQWSDLSGFATAGRSFKVPNPMYFIK